MSGSLHILRAGPLVTIQDRGRFGMLRHGVGESGPMDREAFAESAFGLSVAGTAAIEFTQAGVDFEVVGDDVSARFAGGDFVLAINGEKQPWPTTAKLGRGAKVTIRPGASGNYGYVRFDHEIGVPPVLGSRSTNCTVGLGGYEGRALHAGDELPLVPASEPIAEHRTRAGRDEGPIRVIWGLHADLFPAALRQRFVTEPFEISPRLDRMGVRLADLAGIFGDTRILGLVSDAVVAGDIQVLGDGSPIVLMRDHQPTGGYPRIATILSADLDRFAQMRPRSAVTFQSISPGHAYAARVR
jgi:biotin-dependent carboxylase-like uncharacterized protein